MFCNAVKVLTISPQKPAAPDLMTNRMIIRFELPFGWDNAEVTSEPNALDLLQRKIAVKPAEVFSSSGLPLRPQPLA